MAQFVHWTAMLDAIHETSCCYVLYCVTTGTGAYKLIFGTATKLIIERSKWLLFSITAVDIDVILIELLQWFCNSSWEGVQINTLSLTSI